MGVSLNKALTYGAKKCCLPNHVAQLNAKCHSFKENKALHPTLVLQVKRLGTLQESNHTLAINSLLN